LQTSHVAEHITELQTSEDAYKFIATVTLSYRVCDAIELPTGTPADAERQLWPQVQRILRRASRAYKVTDVAQAEDGIQDTIDARLDKEGIQNFGLEVLSVEVNVNQDDTAQIHAAQLALAEHEAKLGAQKLETALARQPIFDELISNGSWAALAWAVANGKVSEEELYQQMSQAESEQLKLKIALLERLRNDDARSEAQDASASSALLESVVRDVTGRSVPSLPAAGSRPKLPGDKREGA
jgi:preprotein translocase subunit SecD